MKVENIHSVKKIEKKTFRKNYSEFSLSEEIRHVETSITSNVSELFSIYAIEEDLQKQKDQVKTYTDDLFDILEKLRLSLLIQTYSESELFNIRNILKKKIHLQDSKLSEIIDEIELRVQIEITKIELK